MVSEHGTDLRSEEPERGRVVRAPGQRVELPEKGADVTRFGVLSHSLLNTLARNSTGGRSKRPGHTL
jgi:hypothetical protein